MLQLVIFSMLMEMPILIIQINKYLGNLNLKSNLIYWMLRCWIKVQNNADKFGLYFAPFFVIWIFDLIIYVLVSRQIYRFIKNTEMRWGKISFISSYLKRGRATHRIRLYLLVFMLCIGVGVINRIQNAAMGRPLFWLSIIDGIISPLQGFLNRLDRLFKLN